MRNHDNPNKPRTPLIWSRRSNHVLDLLKASSKIFRVFGIEAPTSVKSDVENFIINLDRSMKRLGSEHNALSFYDACKSRYDLLYRKINEILDHLASDPKIVLGKPHGKKVYNLGTNTCIFFILEYEESDEILSVNLIDNINPKAYKFLYKAVANLLIDQYQLDEITDQEEKIENLRRSFMCILTIAKIYENFRGNEKINLYLEEQAYLRLSLDDFKLSESILNDFKSVCDDIDKGRKAPTYVKDLTRAYRVATQLPMDYIDSDYHISCRSTGTKYGNKSINGLLSSILEVDNYRNCRFDELTGYKSHYNIESCPKADQYDRKTISIEQNKLDRRVIHMASNPIQDRVNYYHNRLANLLQVIPTDCTFNQPKGILFATLSTQSNVLNSKRHNIYSLDLSKATDTLSKEFQELCLSIFFGTEMSQEWTNLVSGIHKFEFRDKEVRELRQKRGQPQGYKSSFPAFALAHHIVMRIVMKRCHLESLDPQEFYRILGDDSIIAVNDPDLIVRDTYIQVCKEVGWECNPSKGYTFIWGKDASATAEFAKIRVRDGKVFCPLPLPTFLSLKSDRMVDNLPALLWYSKNINQLSSTDVVDRLESLGIKVFKKTFDMIFYLAEFQLGEFAALKKFKVDIDQNVQLNVLLAYFYNKLKSTILEEWLPTHLGGSGKSSRIKTDPFLGFDKELEFLDLIEDDNHKYWIILDNNERIIHQLNILFGKSSTNLSVARLQMSEDDKDIIYQACELLITGLEKDINPQSFITIVDKAIGVLNQYNPRRSHESYQRESSYLDSMSDILTDITIRRAIV